MQVCGKCLHAKDAHTESFNLMYCPACMSFCAKDEFDTEHKPTSINLLYEMQAKREYTPYRPKEVK